MSQSKETAPQQTGSQQQQGQQGPQPQQTGGTAKPIFRDWAAF